MWQSKNLLIKRVRDRTKVPLPTTAKVVNAFLYELNHALLRRERVLLTQVGVFKVTKDNRQIVKSGLTGKTYPIPTRLTIKFKPSKTVRRLLNETDKSIRQDE